MRGRRVVVLGDVMLDEFVWGHVGRISPEAPVPVVEVSGQSVAANVRSLGGAPVLVGVIGGDDAGRRLSQALADADVASCLETSETGRPTTVKTRVVAHGQQVVRIRSVPLDLGPQAGHRRVDRAGHHAAAVVPHLREQLVRTVSRIDE